MSSRGLREESREKKEKKGEEEKSKAKKSFSLTPLLNLHCFHLAAPPRPSKPLFFPVSSSRCMYATQLDQEIKREKPTFFAARERVFLEEMKPKT